MTSNTDQEKKERISRKTIRVFRSSLILSTILVFISNLAFSQGNDDSKWHFLIDPYILFPNMKGETTVGNLPPSKVDANPGDIFSKLLIGGMLCMEVSNTKWSIGSDILYMNLEQDVKSSELIESGEASAKQFAWEVAGLKRISKWLEAGVAGRMVNLKTEIDIIKKIGSPPEASASVTETWFDPVLVARLQSNIHERWSVQLRGDFGGFGIGSDFTWQVQANAGYKFSNHFQLTAGYRFISIDYDKGSGSERFLYDMTTFGPEVRAVFNF